MSQDLRKMESLVQEMGLKGEKMQLSLTSTVGRVKSQMKMFWCIKFLTNSVKECKEITS